MLQNIIVLNLLIGFMFAIVNANFLEKTSAITPTLALGFLLLSAYCAGNILERFKLPKISGYILAGLVFGPYVMALVPKEAVANLSFVNSLALAFIAFCAGGELKTSHLKHQVKSIVNLVISQTLIVFFGVSTAVFLLLVYFPVFTEIDNAKRLVISLIFGIISVARSPSSTIAVITETKAAGRYTDIVLSVTIVKDVAVIVLFGIVVSVSKTLISASATIEYSFFMVLIFEIIVAIILGIVLGHVFIYLIETVKVEFPVVIIGAGFLIIKFSHLFTSYLHESFNIAINFEPLLICMTAGFVVQNFSDFGDKFLNKMDRVSVIIYVAFFALTGISIDIEILRTAWIFGLILVGIRLAMLYVASIVSGVVSGDEPLIYKNYWLGFITQAGVSLGLLTEIVRRFPSIGLPIQSLLIAAITINQLLGPIAFKWALTRVGETNR